MKSINPFINFNGKCRQAMTFYKECLGGELELMEVAGSPMEENWKGPKDQILHASLIVNRSPVIMGSDMIDQSGYTQGNNIALALDCQSEDEIRNFFEKLSQSGKVIKSLSVEFWGGLLGSVEDKFGIKWFLNYDRK
ncbi:MAG: VOC family protein [Ginsengibacter sp.]